MCLLVVSLLWPYLWIGEFDECQGKMWRLCVDWEAKQMTEKSCGFCKHCQLDGMFGMWCDIHDDDWVNIDAEKCSDYERWCGMNENNLIVILMFFRGNNNSFDIYRTNTCGDV